MAGHTHDSCPYLIHSSLNLYAMVCKQLENPPQAHESNFRNDMQAICHGKPNDLMICTYLSPLDAVMGSLGLCGEDDYFWPLDLRCLDTRALIHGTTDAQGRTERHATDIAESTHVFLGHRSRI
ncbi:hypothetical protein LMG28614_00602 [Paraburkholderia ultramafica]|uniref:Uncharacterized protein n=1 Tax=Paraburkholderia ultramafica TaxID=1544867 RepID=A0A6S7B0Z7_9BURK|nr:hypothetical protein [Paraburkholderia ultramafica]CAB3778376.1 hypothetical protein LMG28614_00602 [Paraburkholderia ultramafica]